MTNRGARCALFLCAALVCVARLAGASFYTLSASGTITSNTSGDSTIPIGTPWTLELTYDSAAPDLDFELLGSPDPTYGRFTNSAAPPALSHFRYRAGSYEVTVDDPADFGAFSEIAVTFTSVNAMDINIQAPALFPPLAGGVVSFHADFNRFAGPPIFSSDSLPTNTELGPESFHESTVTLLPPAGVISSSTLTSLALRVLRPGDANRDGGVDLVDFGLLKAHFGGPGNWGKGDFDGSGAIDLTDFGLLKANFGQGGGTAVPEPASWRLAALAALAGGALRRRPRARPASGQPSVR